MEGAETIPVMLQEEVAKVEAELEEVLRGVVLVKLALMEQQILEAAEVELQEVKVALLMLAVLAEVEL